MAQVCNLCVLPGRTRHPNVHRSARWTGPLLALLLVGCGLGDFDNYAPLSFLDNFHAIKPGVAYRSAQLDALTFGAVIDWFEIKTVINLRGENEDERWYQNEVAAVSAAGATHVDIRMSARELPPRAELLKLYETFLDAEYPILIHCKAGADRAGAASAIWRMVVSGDSKDEAKQELCVCHGHLAPVTLAMDQLLEIFQPSREWIRNEYPAPRE